MRLSTPTARRRASAFLATLMLGASLQPALAMEAQTLTPAEVQRDLQQLFREAREALADLPRQTFDPAAIVQTVGRDPEALRDWVATHTVAVPYQGHLRDPGAVIMDGSGNALDRAILLAELLHIAGHQSEIAHVQLSEEALQERLLTPFLARPSLRTHRPPDAFQFSDEITDATQREALSLHQRRYERLLESIGARVADQLPRVSAWLEDAPPPASARSADATHWWIRVQQGETWLDLDLTGDAPEQAAGTLTFETLSEAPAHQVRIDYIIEQWLQGELTEKTAVSHTVGAARMGQRPIRIGASAGELEVNLEDFQTQPEAATAKLRKAAAEQVDWLPFIQVDNETIADKSFNTQGDLHTDHRATAQARALGQASGLLGGIGRRDDAPPPGVLSAAYIDFTLIDPDGTEHTERRQLFDLLGADARLENNIPETEWTPEEPQQAQRGLALSGQSDLIIQTSRIDRDFVSDLSLQQLLRNRQSLLGSVHYHQREDGKAMQTAMAQVQPFPGHLYQWTVLRSEMNPTSDRLYLDRPNLVAWHEVPVLTPEDDLLLRRGIDIIQNRFQVAGPEDDHRQLRLRQGLTDAAIEAVLLEQAEGGTVSASTHLATLPPDTWQVYRNEADFAPVAENYSAEARVRIQAAFARGEHVVLPGAAANIAAEALTWWELNPETGHVFARDVHGRGSSWEYAAIFFSLKNGLFILTISAIGCKNDPSIGCWICMALSGVIIAIATFGNPEWAAGALVSNIAITPICAIASS